MTLTFEEWWSIGTYGIAYDAAKAAWEAATKVERERCAEVLEQQHTWITATGAACIVRRLNDK
mgnify:CR=1 FL=1